MSRGRFGVHGGQYMSETLMNELLNLEEQYNHFKEDPDFVNELRAHDLTSSEIGLCCLYLLGLNIPEAGEVIGKVSSVYNVNSSIRKKIGVSGTNLDKWLVKCFAELHPSQICETANVNN